MCGLSTWPTRRGLAHGSSRCTGGIQGVGSAYSRAMTWALGLGGKWHPLLCKPPKNLGGQKPTVKRARLSSLGSQGSQD